MRKTITALLVTAALVGSTGALADRWQGDGNDNNHHGNGNGGQSWSGQGGSGQGGNGQSHTQSQNGGSGDHHWGSRSSSTIQAGSTISGGHDSQGGSGAQFQVQSNEHHWNGGNNDHGQWNSGNNDHGQWNGGDGGHDKHYHWSDGDHGDHDQWRHGDHDGHDWDHRAWNRGNWNHGEWQLFRDRNRDRFHLRRYVDPRGWSYRRFYRGYTIDPYFYAQQYWIDDPYDYRLPPAYGPYRWVRYYNDAVLVNIYTGEVEDVIYDFFW